MSKFLYKLRTQKQVDVSETGEQNSVTGRQLSPKDTELTIKADESSIGDKLGRVPPKWLRDYAQCLSVILLWITVTG